MEGDSQTSGVGRGCVGARRAEPRTGRVREVETGPRPGRRPGRPAQTAMATLGPASQGLLQGDAGMAAATASAEDAAPLPRSKGIYLCDLRPGISEAELAQVFSQYGDIVSMCQADPAPDEGVLIEYATYEAAEEAQSTVNLAAFRGRTCRCMLVSALEVIRHTMATGQRVVIEDADPALELSGLWAVFGLFGQVLDCNLRHVEGQSSVGFAHFLHLKDAQRAIEVLAGMQIGENVVKLRPFRWDDAALFSGARHAAPAPPRAAYNPYSDAYSDALGGAPVLDLPQ